MVEAVLIVAAQDFVGLQHFVASQHQLGKINHAFAVAGFIVFGVALDQALGVRVGRGELRCAQAVFFLGVDKALQRAWGDDFFGDVELLEQAFD